jgi:hypothetical protein
MPHIVVWNLTESDFEERKIEEIEKTLTTAVVNIPDLELRPDDISFAFPRDPTVTSDKIPIIIIVDLLFDKPKRTFEMRQLLAERIGTFFSAAVNWRKLTKIEVAVKRFDPKKEGFYTKDLSNDVYRRS